MQITIIKKILNEKQAIALEACKKNVGKKKSISENLATAEKEGRDAAKAGKKSHECPYGEEGSWDEKHSRSAWFKGFKGFKEFKAKNESLDEAVNKDYEAAAKLAKELTAYANSLKTGDTKATLDSQEAHYKAFEAHFKAYDLAHTDPKHKEHLKLADKHLSLAGHRVNEMADSGYVSRLQKSVNVLKAHLQRHGLEHTFTQNHLNTTLKSLGHSSQITHHDGLDDIRKVTDNNKPAPTAAELIVRHMSIHGSKNESFDENVGEPEEGWCIVDHDGKVTGCIHSHLNDAKEQQKRITKHTTIKWGKRASDGSNEHIQTRAVNPTNESIEHDFINHALAKKDINVIKIEKHPEAYHVIVDKENKGAAAKILKHHGLDKEYHVKTNESVNEESNSFHIKIKKYQKDAVEAALKQHEISYGSYPLDAQHHGISISKEHEAKARRALVNFNPVSDNSSDVSDKVRTTNFDDVLLTAAKVKKRADIKKAIARKLKNKNESDEEFEAQMISENVDADAVKKLSAAIKANPEIEEALFQLISAIMTNPKMFEANPSAVVNKIAASSKVPASKLQAVVDALGIE